MGSGTGTAAAWAGGRVLAAEVDDAAVGLEFRELGSGRRRRAAGAGLVELPAVEERGRERGVGLAGERDGLTDVAAGVAVGVERNLGARAHLLAGLGIGAELTGHGREGNREVVAVAGANADGPVRAGGRVEPAAAGVVGVDARLAEQAREEAAAGAGTRRVDDGRAAVAPIGLHGAQDGAALAGNGERVAGRLLGAGGDQPAEVGAHTVEGRHHIVAARIAATRLEQDEAADAAELPGSVGGALDLLLLLGNGAVVDAGRGRATAAGAHPIELDEAGLKLGADAGGLRAGGREAPGQRQRHGECLGCPANQAHFRSLALMLALVRAAAGPPFQSKRSMRES